MNDKLNFDEPVLSFIIICFVIGLVNYFTGAGLSTALLLGMSITFYGSRVVVSGFIDYAIATFILSVWVGFAYSWPFGVLSFIVLPFVPIALAIMIHFCMKWTRALR